MSTCYMMMNQSSLSYSGDDSASIQLSQDIQNFVAPNVKGSTSVEFDGYGTLHVLDRDDNGRLLKDSYLPKQEEVESFNATDDYTNADKLEDLIRKNAKLGIAVKVRDILIVLFVFVFLLFCILLYATLQRVM